MSGRPPKLPSAPQICPLVQLHLVLQPLGFGKSYLWPQHANVAYLREELRAVSERQATIPYSQLLDLCVEL